MIDAELLDDLGAGTRWDRLIALVLGLVALLAASLVLVQTVQGQAEARASAMASRITADVIARIVAYEAREIALAALSSRSVQPGFEGLARGQVALELGGEGGEVLGAAGQAATFTLIGQVAEMKALPGPEVPLDAYARAVLASSAAEIDRLVRDGQNRQRDLADAASSRSNEALLGLSVIALAGVLAGLAAVVGRTRTGRLLIALAYAATGASFVLLLLAARPPGGP